MQIEQTIAERGKTHGDFSHNAAMSQLLKKTMRTRGNWENLKWEQQEALEMIACKISRILSGGASHVDSWHDIAGYATLIEKILLGVQNDKPKA